MLRNRPGQGRILAGVYALMYDTLVRVTLVATRPAWAFCLINRLPA